MSLSRSKQKKLDVIFTSLIKKEHFSLLSEHVGVANLLLTDACTLSDARMLSSHIQIAKCYIDLVINMHPIIIPSINISNLSNKIINLLATEEDKIAELENDEEYHAALVASPRLSSKPSFFKNSYTDDGRAAFFNGIANLDKLSNNILFLLSSKCCDIIKDKLIFPLLDAHLDHFVNTNYADFNDGVMKLTQLKTQAALDLYTLNFRRFWGENAERIKKFNALSTINNTIYALFFALKKIDKLKSFPKLLNSQEEIEKYILFSPKSDNRIEIIYHINKLEKMIEKLYILQSKKIHALDELKFKPGHHRQRSKSTNHLPEPNQAPLKSRAQRKTLAPVQIKRHEYKRSTSQGQLLFAKERIKNATQTNSQQTTQEKCYSPH